jgi:hypothetical protein
VRDIAGEVGLAETTRTYGAVVFDYDSDGWPDVLLGRHSSPAYLYRNDNGHFVRVEKVRFPRGPDDKQGGPDRHWCAAGDVNGDARADVYCAIGGVDGTAPKPDPNELFLQAADGTFVDDGNRPDLADPYGRGRQVVLFDADKDGDLDIFLGNASPRADGRTSQNRLFLNEGSAGWRSAPARGLDREISVGSAGHGLPRGCLEVFDADGDEWPDVLLCGKAKGDRSQRTYLFHNSAGRRFRDDTASSGLTGPALDASAADFDGDGDVDVVTVNATELRVLLQDKGKYTVAFRMPLEYGVRVAVADANGDHRPDVYVMRGASTGGPAGSALPNKGDLLLLRKAAKKIEFESRDMPELPVRTKADDVFPIDHDRDGRWEFLVLNGFSDDPGPVQLVAVS